MHLPQPLATFVVFSLTSFAAAQTQSAAYAGTYAEHLGSRTFRVLRLELTDGQLHGTLDQPRGFNGAISFSVSDPRSETWLVVKSQLRDGALYFTVQSPRDKADTDDFVLRLSGEGAELAEDDPEAAVEPSRLDRVSSAQVSTGWQLGRMYSPDDSDTDNPEMKSLYDADQKVREGPMPTAQADILSMYNSDTARRKRTREMLSAGLLHTGRDFERAAFIFQHGDAPDDFLLAHTLAMVSVSRGDSNSIWIAAATLDRYLQKIGKAQVYGTQFGANSSQVWTQEPYDRGFISDPIRAALNVPSQSTQDRQLNMLQKQQPHP